MLISVWLGWHRRVAAPVGSLRARIAWVFMAGGGILCRRRRDHAAAMLQAANGTRDLHDTNRGVQYPTTIVPVPVVANRLEYENSAWHRNRCRLCVKSLW